MRLSLLKNIHLVWFLNRSMMDQFCWPKIPRNLTCTSVKRFYAHLYNVFSKVLLILHQFCAKWQRCLNTFQTYCSNIQSTLQLVGLVHRNTLETDKSSSWVLRRIMKQFIVMLISSSLISSCGLKSQQDNIQTWMVFQTLFLIQGRMLVLLMLLNHTTVVYWHI